MWQKFQKQTAVCRCEDGRVPGVDCARRTGTLSGMYRRCLWRSRCLFQVHTNRWRHVMPVTSPYCRGACRVCLAMLCFCDRCQTPILLWLSHGWCSAGGWNHDPNTKKQKQKTSNNKKQNNRKNRRKNKQQQQKQNKKRENNLSVVSTYIFFANRKSNLHFSKNCLKSEIMSTASILKQDPNIQKARKVPILIGQWKTSIHVWRKALTQSNRLTSKRW